MAIIDELKKQKVENDKWRKQMSLMPEEKNNVDKICDEVFEDLIYRVEREINSNKRKIEMLGKVSYCPRHVVSEKPVFCFYSGDTSDKDKKYLKKGQKIYGDTRNGYWSDKNKAQLIANKLEEKIRTEFRPAKLKICVQELNCGSFFNPVYYYTVGIDFTIKI